MNVKDRRPDHNTGNYVPYSCEQCVGSLTSHKVIMNKDCKTGPTIYRPYPRRLDSLTICRYHYKGSTFSSINLKTLSVGPAGVWTRTSRTGARCSTNWANRSAASEVQTLYTGHPSFRYWKGRMLIFNASAVAPQKLSNNTKSQRNTHL